MHAASTLKFGAEPDCCGQFDNRWLVLDFLGLCDRRLNSIQIVITIFHMLCVEAISLEAFQNIFGESNLGVAICIEQIS